MINSVFSGNLAYIGRRGRVLVTRVRRLTPTAPSTAISPRASRPARPWPCTSTTAALTNCILWDYADNHAGQIALTGYGQIRAEVDRVVLRRAGRRRRIIRKGNATVTWGTRNLNVDPSFQNPAGPDHVAGTIDDDLHLHAGSPCIDAGDNVAVPPDIDDLDADGDRQERIPFDLDGHTRFVDDPATANTGVADVPLYPAIVDLGAYEFRKP